MVNTIDWGVPIEDFPTGAWDNFDGRVVQVEYQFNEEFGWQIEIYIQPEEYEYESRGYEFDPDGLPPVKSWYSMGGRNDDWHSLSADGYIVEGKQINARTQALKFIKGVMAHTNVTLSKGNIKPLIGAFCHFKNEQGGINPETGVRTTRVKPYAVSEAVGASGSTLDESTLNEAFDLIKTVMATEETLTIRNFAQKAIEFDGEFPSDIIKLASQSDTIEKAVRAGHLVKVDERTVALP